MATTNENTSSSYPSPQLQVLICTYGHEGLKRIADCTHPRVEGVEYLVSCQSSDDLDHQIPQKLERDDFRVFISKTKGLSVNRNLALSLATAPLLLLSDDDVEYTEEGLLAVINAFAENPDSDLLAFRYESSGTGKYYPCSPAMLDKSPKGYYVSSIEIAMRRKSIQGKIRFNENFGIGATFPSGEEDIFVRDCLDAGLNGKFLPVTIARHDGPTTSERNLMLPSRPLTKGAVFLRLHPRQWPLRMLVHAMREIPSWRKGRVPSPLSYCINWLRGVRMAHKMNVFPTPDRSFNHPGHD